MRKSILSLLALACGWAATAAAQQANPLQIPPLLTGPTFTLNLHEDSTQFLSGAKTATKGMNQSYLAPTLMMHRGDFVTLNVQNGLPDTTTMHWHGMHVAAADDGGPHTTIAPGVTWSPDFTVLDEASTYWYHPHLHMHTAEQVYWGAAGMIIVHDSLEESLNLPRTYGVDDFPFIIQDKSFDSLSNQLIYEAISDTMMVNGTLNPFLNVPGQVVRFRYLNASNQRVYNLGFPPNVSYMISSDGGLLAQPLPITRILLAPGERVEVLIDFGQLTGAVPLLSYSSEMGAGISGGPAGPGGGPGNPLDGVDFRVCEFRVVAPTANPVTTIPTNLRTYNHPDPQNAARTRVKYFDVDIAGFPYYINSTPYDHDVINDTMRLGDIEVWEVSNLTDVAHPLHIHDVQFTVTYFNGPFVPGHLRGRKDVVLVQPGDTIHFVTQFEDFADEHTPYMFHCHNLFHEDGGMMGQFIVMDSVLSGHGDPDGGCCHGVTVSPNPTGGMAYLDDVNPDVHRLVSVEVWDLHGRLLQSQALDLGSRRHPVDLSAYAPGMYLLHMRFKGGGHAAMRLVRQ